MINILMIVTVYVKRLNDEKVGVKIVKEALIINYL